MLKLLGLSLCIFITLCDAKSQPARKRARDDSKCDGKGKPLTLTILHTNDIHSHIEESNAWGGPCLPDKKNSTEHCVAGVTRLARAIKKMRHQNPDALLMNAGDFYQGSVWYTVLKHEIVSAVMKELRYDAICLGNHEFDDGPAGLAPFLGNMTQVGTKVITSNVDTTKEPLLDGKEVLKSHVFCVNGTKVGVIGAVTEETRTIASPGLVIIEDVIPALKREAKKLKEQGIKVIVAITHTGFDVDPDIVKEVEDIDILVGGHTNTLLYNGNPAKGDKAEGAYPTVVERKDGSKALIVQDFWFAKYLGFIRVRFDKDGNVKHWAGNPRLVDHRYKEDQRMKALLAPYRDRVNEAGKRPIGSSKVLLSADNKTCRLHECNMMNMVTDSFLAHYADQETPEDTWSDVSAAIVNSGFARSSLPKTDNLTMFDIMRALPYESTLVVLTLNGQQLRRMFEHSVANFTVSSDPRGEFLAVSGIKVKYDLAKPSKSRVVLLQILCSKCVVPRYEDVVDETVYRVATTSYITNGGDGFKFDKTVKKETKGVVDSEVYIPYIQKMSPLKTPVEGRVVIDNYPSKPLSGRSDMSWKREIWV